MKKVFAIALGAALAGGLMFTALGTSAVQRIHTTAAPGDTAARAAGVAARRAWTIRVYKGRFRENGPDTLIKIKARVKDGEATAVTRMRYRANMDCDQSGEIPGEAGWVFRGGGLKVNDKRKFRVQASNGQVPQSTLLFKGRFSPSFNRVTGVFKTHQWFEAQKNPPLPAEYCNLARTRYGARR